MNRFILHVEGLTVFLFSLSFYAYYDFSWLLFILLLFVPDLAMLGYLVSLRIGAIVYNIFHTYFFSALAIGAGIFFGWSCLFALGLIWCAHIGMDRLFGFGLKYPGSFQDTHMQRL